MNLKTTTYIAVLLVLSTLLLIPRESRQRYPYRSPLDKHNGYSSSFQEFRSSHFHGGVDFRTFNRTGLPVHAISDGKVFRLRVVKRGSGRGVYLRHADGNTSLYFHLERFSPELEALVKKRRKRMGKKYVGNIELNPPIAVEAGRIIGYSGETGAGFPHLHLEIRDPEGNKLNPFLLVNAGFRDKNPPLIEAVLLRSRGSGMINGRVGEIRIPMKRVNGAFRVEKPIVTTGGMDVVVGARDISDTGRSVAPGMITARLDGKPVFNLRFRRFSWEDNNQLGFVYDMRESRSSRFYFKLYSQAGNEFERTGVSLRRVMDSLAQGEHEFRVYLEDYFGNGAEGRIPIIRCSTPRVRLGSLIRRKGKLSIEVVESRTRGVDRVDAALINGAGMRISTRTIQGGIEAPGLLDLKEPGPATLVELTFFTRGVAFSAHRFSVASGRASRVKEVKVDPYLSGDDALLRIRDFPLGADSLRMRLAVGEKEWQHPRTSLEGLYFILAGRKLPPSSRNHRVPIQFGIVENERMSLLLQQSVSLIRLVPGQIGAIRSGAFFARFGPRTVRQPRLMSLSVTHHPVPFPQLTEQIRLTPDHFAFLDRVDYGFQARVKRPQQAAIFKWDAIQKKWKYRSTAHDGVKGVFSTRVRASGTFTLLRDTEPPAIGFRRIRASRLPLITITDKGTGVDDESVKVFMDGALLDSEYDPDRRWVRFEALPEISPGIHRVEVRCLDRAKNRRARKIRWRIRVSSRKKG